jgi:hypothetical protein
MQQVQHQAQHVAQQAFNWLSAQRDPGCMTAHTVAGAGAGMATGAVIGAFGGPADVATVPLGAATGYMGGAALGRLGGLVTCMSASGSGSGTGTGSAGQEKPTAQLKKLSPSEIRKLETEGGAHQNQNGCAGHKERRRAV